MAAVAYDVVDNRLVERWVFDTGHNSSHPAFGQGNHNVMPAAVHAGSSRQSLFLGASAIRYDGELLWSSGRGHGDALHVGNFIPGRTQSNGIQVFSPFETAPYGIALFDGVSGEELWRQTASGDTGRAMAGNFVRSNTGAEFWGAGDMRGSTGQRLGNSPDTPSFAIWWDGGLERQLLNNTGRDEGWMRIDRVTNVNGDRERIFTAHATSINGTKANPNLSANIFGDWREQLIMREGNVLRVFTTTHSTEHRITTLMHDPHYRMQVAGQNICYNQPPHTSFYMGTGVEIQRVPVRVRGSAEPDPDLPDPDLPELCTLCDELPCVCPPPVARVVRLQQRELCELCGEDKIWQVTMLFAGADDETARLIRRAAKRNSAGAVLEPCEHSHSLEP
jgi:rhamnogalacturonan endolyase